MTTSFLILVGALAVGMLLGALWGLLTLTWRARVRAEPWRRTDRDPVIGHDQHGPDRRRAQLGPIGASGFPRRPVR